MCVCVWTISEILTRWREAFSLRNRTRDRGPIFVRDRSHRVEYSQAEKSHNRTSLNPGNGQRMAK